MKTFVACIALALASVARGEAPGGYSYSRPSGGYSSGGISLSSGGGGYRPVSSGYQTSEGQSVDPQLLEQIRQILLREESSSSAGGYSAPSSSYGAPQASYSAPSSSYGVPSQSYGAPSRVSGISLEGVRQALQVAEYEQGGGYSGGYPSASYGAPARAPSGSYGAPY